MSIVNLLMGLFKGAEVTFDYLGFRLDCHLDEVHESGVTTTENPIEGGAVSTDHATIMPKVISIRGIVINYEPSGGGASDARMGNLYENLVSLQEQKQKATVRTKLKTYENMILTSVVASRSAEDQLELVMQFKEIITVEVETVGGLVVAPPPSTAPAGTPQATKPDGEKKSPKPANQASKPSNKGKTQPKPQPQTQTQKKKGSVLHDVFG